jgi:hypothetical protein
MITRTLRGIRVITTLTLLLTVSLTVASQSETVILPNTEGEWILQPIHVGRVVDLPIRVDIDGVGVFHVHAEGIQTLRPDIIQTPHFSIFDLVVKLGESGEIDLAYHYDERMATHVIDSIDGISGWWHEAHYSGGWFEKNAHRMDQYLVKDETFIRLYQERESRLVTLFTGFREEVERLEERDGIAIIPKVSIEGPGRAPGVIAENVIVTAHDSRLDLFQPGTITALDILLSLGEQGILTQLGVTWYDTIFTADPVDHYFVEQIRAGEVFDAQAYGSCGFVYEVGSRRLAGFSGAHIHIPTDARVLVSPEYALWFWICLQERIER